MKNVTKDLFAPSPSPASEVAPVLRRALVSGTVAGVTTAVTAALTARAQGMPAAAPINAVSHVVWAGDATRKNTWSGKYTLLGFAINHASAIFWATLYEALIAGRSAGRSTAEKLAAGALTSAVAYVTDYHLMPDRLTPGYEKRLSKRGLAPIFAALALSLPLRSLLDPRR